MVSWPTRVGLGLVLLWAAAALAHPSIQVSVPPAKVEGQDKGRTTAVEWGPDGKVLIAANGLLARFDLDSDQEELLDDTGVTFALSPPEASGGSRLALGGRKRLELRRYPDFQLLAAFDTSDPGLAAPADIYALAWSPNGKTLAAGTRGGHILLWEVASRELWADLGVEPISPVARLRFSADGTRLLAALEDGRAVLWDIQRREILHRFELPRTARGELEADTSVVALSPDGRQVLATQVRGEEAELLLLDDAGMVKWRRGGYGVEFTPDGAGVLALAPPFRIAALYRAADAEALRVFEPPEGVATLYLVRLSPDGTKLLGLGEDHHGQVLIVWDFATGEVLKARR